MLKSDETNTQMMREQAGRLFRKKCPNFLGQTSQFPSCVPGDHVPPAGAVGAGGALVGLLPRVGPLVGGQVVRPVNRCNQAGKLVVSNVTRAVIAW